MTDIIEQCAIASLNDHRKRKGISKPLNDLSMIDGDHWLADTRAALVAFKKLTAEPTPKMIELGCAMMANEAPEDMRLSWPDDFTDGGQKRCRDAVRDTHRAMHAKMFEEMGL